MGEDILAYVDHFDDNQNVWSDEPGFEVEENGTELAITGDGTSEPYTTFKYIIHDTETGIPLVIDMTSNDKLYVKAKSTVAGTMLRIDLADSNGFVTTAPATLL